MLNTSINPFVAILFMTVIGATGTLFVVHKIFETPLTVAQQDARIGISPADLLKNQ